MMQGTLEPPESALDRVLSSNPHTCLVLPLVPAGDRVWFSKLSTPTKAHTVQRGHSGRYRRPPVGMPLGPGAWVFSGWDREGGHPLRARE